MAMRTTLNLDDDILHKVKQYAGSRSVALGKAASDLIRRGLASPVQTKVIDGFHVVVLPSGSPRVDTQHVKNILEEEF